MPRRKKINKPKANVYMYVSSRTKGRTSLRVIIISLVAIFFVVIGLMLVVFFTQKISVGKKTEIKTQPLVQEEKKTEEKSTSKIIIPEEIFNLSGVIMEIKNDSLIFDAKIPYLDESGIAMSKNESREAIIGVNTELKKMSIIAKEGTNKKTVQETNMNFSELKVGDYIEAIARENIKDLVEFEAAKIRIMQ